jgi:transcriptional regulator with XRE-family HTH domain
MKLHIGEKIKQRASELRIGPTELAKRINTSKQNVYGIYKRKSVDSELLKSLSEALDYDFFTFYYTIPVEIPNLLKETEVVYGNKKHINPYDVILQLEKELVKSRKELSNLEEKYKLQIKINSLLEKKK